LNSRVLAIAALVLPRTTAPNDRRVAGRSGRQDQILLTGVLDLGAAVLAVQDGVADLDVERDPLGAGVVEPTRTHRKDFTLLGLLLRGVRDHEAGSGGLLGVEGLDDDSVLKRLDGDGHVLPPLWECRESNGFGSRRRRGCRRPPVGTLSSRVPTLNLGEA
jgi:hypothetical protein